MEGSNPCSHVAGPWAVVGCDVVGPPSLQGYGADSWCKRSSKGPLGLFCEPFFVQMNARASPSSLLLSVAIRLPPEPISMEVQANGANLLSLLVGQLPVLTPSLTPIGSARVGLGGGR